MGKKYVLLLVCCLVIAITFISTGCSSIKPDSKAPDFELMNLEGEVVSLSDYRGNAVMLNFWASWCGPCRYEMPFFQEIYEDIKWKASGLVLIAVNIDESGFTAAGFMEANGFDFMVLLDTTGEVANKYNVRGIPATFFIDERGIIRYSDVGAFMSKAHVEQRLRELLE
ncbi:MAG TPA: TlpA family protein disulfide reductase [Dehalococcoidia bacterium]|nr:TlpA family protein disulfide reductase [Dehalococcoidia bacterium]